MSEENLKILTDIVAGVSTVSLAVITYLMVRHTKNLAQATVSLANESKEASYRQIRLDTWMKFAKGFDSKEIREARNDLRGQIYFTPKVYKALVSHKLLKFLEDLAIVYNGGYINKELAVSSFNFHVIRWWAILEPYIAMERAMHNNDTTLFAGFEAMAKDMNAEKTTFAIADLEKFLQDERMESA
jgi:hypothetical protein